MRIRVAARGQEKEEMGSYYKKGIKFQSSKMKNL
jgi:hypothetical protein